MHSFCKKKKTHARSRARVCACVCVCIYIQFLTFQVNFVIWKMLLCIGVVGQKLTLLSLHTLTKTHTHTHTHVHAHTPRLDQRREREFNLNIGIDFLYYPYYSVRHLKKWCAQSTSVESLLGLMFTKYLKFSTIYLQAYTVNCYNE
jgi:hypothetical protein